jgi:uncharacterized protein YkuJ
MEIELSKDSTKDIIYCEIEHVMPQEITDDWMGDIKDWNKKPDGSTLTKEEIEEKIDFRTHVAGNLTLISQGGNKALSNKRFVTKQHIPGVGFKNSNYQITRRDFGEIPVWTFDKIDARTLEIFEFIKRRFNYKANWNFRVKL